MLYFNILQSHRLFVFLGEKYVEGVQRKTTIDLVKEVRVLVAALVGDGDERFARRVVVVHLDALILVGIVHYVEYLLGVLDCGIVN